MASPPEHSSPSPQINADTEYARNFGRLKSGRPSSAPPGTLFSSSTPSTPSHYPSTPSSHSTHHHHAPHSPTTPRYHPHAHSPTTPRVFPTSADPYTPPSPSPARSYPSHSAESTASRVLPTEAVPATPRYDLHSPQTSRYSKYDWNRPRDPLLEGEQPRISSGKKQVPTYFENLEKLDEDSKRLSRKSRPEPTPFIIDPTRAGIPTLIRRVRTREEDIFTPKRPSTAPARDNDIPAAGAPLPQRNGRLPCQIEKFNVKRNPLLESGEVPPSRKVLIGFNKESDREVTYSKKTILTPPSVQKAARTTEYYVPGELPQSPPIRIRPYAPDDSDVFNHTHPLVAPEAPQLTGALDKERARETQERELERAYQQRVAFYNDEIKKFKIKAKLKGNVV